MYERDLGELNQREFIKNWEKGEEGSGHSSKFGSKPNEVLYTTVPNGGGKLLMEGHREERARAARFYAEQRERKSSK